MENGWIDARKKLPENEVEVLVKVENFCAIRTIYAVGYIKEIGIDQRRVWSVEGHTLSADKKCNDKTITFWKYIK